MHKCYHFHAVDDCRNYDFELSPWFPTSALIKGLLNGRPSATFLDRIIDLHSMAVKCICNILNVFQLYFPLPPALNCPGYDFVGNKTITQHNDKNNMFMLPQRRHRLLDRNFLYQVIFAWVG